MVSTTWFGRGGGADQKWHHSLAAALACFMSSALASLRALISSALGSFAGGGFGVGFGGVFFHCWRLWHWLSIVSSSAKSAAVGGGFGIGFIFHRRQWLTYLPSTSALASVASFVDCGFDVGFVWVLAYSNKIKSS